jgi:hypothetical protein
MIKSAVSAAVLLGAAGAIFAANPLAALQNQQLMSIGIVRTSHAGALLKKSAQSTMLPVRDSTAFFDFSGNKYVPGAIEITTYSSDGRLISEEQKVINDSLAQPRAMENSMTIYTADAQGNFMTFITQIKRNDLWINKQKWQFSPSLDIAAAANLVNGSESGTGFYLNCRAAIFYLATSGLKVQTWDTLADTWTNYIFDTVNTLNATQRVIAVETWDTVTQAFQNRGADTLYISGGRVTQENGSYVGGNFRSIATYDAFGNETEELQISALLGTTFVTKILQTFDDHNNLLSSIQQDSTDQWVPIDSCPKKLFSYSYDNSGLVVSRVDSAWYSNTDIVVNKHFFTYQSFPNAVVPRQITDKNPRRMFISASGILNTAAPVSVDVFAVSGKRLCNVMLSASGSLWSVCNNRGITVSKGVYLAKVRGTNASFTVWHE